MENKGGGDVGLDIRARAEGRYCDNKTIESEVTGGKYLNIIKAEGERGKGVGPRSKTL